MLASTLWQKEVAEILANRRSLAIRIAFPTVIGGSFLMAAPPGYFTATLVTTLAAALGCFGTSITLSRARTEGTLQRIVLTPLSRRRIVIEQLAVNSGVVFCQLLPLALIVAIRFGAYDFRFLVFLMALGAALAAASLLGLLATVFASSTGEAALYSFLALLPTLYLARVFDSGGLAGDLRSFVAAGVPFSYLQQALLATMGEGTTWSATAMAEASLVVGCAVVLLGALIAPRALRIEA